MFDKIQQFKELKKMRDQAIQIQRELDNEIIEVEKHGIIVRISLAQKIKAITTNGRSDEDLVDTLNEAIKKSQEEAAKKMKDMVGGVEALKGLFGS